VEKALHIACEGSAAGRLLAGLGCGPAAILIHGDNLSCGPLRPLHSPEQWQKMRERFWSQLTARTAEETDLAGRESLLGNLDRLRTAEAVTLWLGTGLADQLFSIWFVQLAELVGLDLPRIRVVDVARGPAAARSHRSFVHVGPELIAAYPPGHPLTTSAVGEMRAAWSAVTAQDPEPLLALLATSPPERPELQRALRSLPARFPDARTGLTRREEQLLRSVLARGPRVGDILEDLYAQTADDLDDPYLDGVLGRLYRMAAPRSQIPAVAMSPPPTPEHRYEVRVAADGAEIFDPPFDAEARITPDGQDILAGRKHMVELNGIDDWVCGIHLDSVAGRVWYRSGDSVQPSGR
jgi:hypothetical protein